jgi:hypothetical protein
LDEFLMLVFHIMSTYVRFFSSGFRKDSHGDGVLCSGPI